MWRFHLDFKFIVDIGGCAIFRHSTSYIAQTGFAAWFSSYRLSLQKIYHGSISTYTDCGGSTRSP